MEAIKSDKGAWFDPLCESEGIVRSKRGQIRDKRRIDIDKRIVGTKKSVREATTHIISSTNMHKTSIAPATIVK